MGPKKPKLPASSPEAVKYKFDYNKQRYTPYTPIKPDNPDFLKDADNYKKIQKNSNYIYDNQRQIVGKKPIATPPNPASKYKKIGLNSIAPDLGNMYDAVNLTESAPLGGYETAQSLNLIPPVYSPEVIQSSLEGIGIDPNVFNINPKPDSSVNNTLLKTQGVQLSNTPQPNVGFELPSLTQDDLFPMENTGWNLNNVDHNSILPNSSTTPTTSPNQKNKPNTQNWALYTNLIDYGLNFLSNQKNLSDQKAQEQKNALINQIPEMVYYNQRQLRGDKAFMKEGGEYELSEEEIENLKRQGYDFEIL